MDKITLDTKERRARRKFRIRKKVKGTTERPRLILCKSLRYLSAQIIDDSKHTTVVGCSTFSKDIAQARKNAKDVKAATILGNRIAALAKENGITKVVFDRNGYLYHGKIKACVDTIRAQGIEV